MKISEVLNPPPLFVEIGLTSLIAVSGAESVELPLARQTDGRLAAAGREKLVAALKDFLKAKTWQPRARALCAISARGVSLRRLSLPGGTPEEFHQRLRLQIEAEFPLSPDELAWGWQPLGQLRPTNGGMAKQELLVAAVKKEVVADYHELLRACGMEPVFTLAALARGNLCAHPADSFALLDTGVGQVELTIFEKGVPASSRIVSCGYESSAEGTNGTPDALAQAIKGHVAGTTLFISGRKISDDFVARLAVALGNGCRCERLEVAPRGDVARTSRWPVSEPPAPAPGGNSQAGRLCHYEGSAAIAGLQAWAARGDDPPLLLRLEHATGTATSFADLDWKKWSVRVGALVAALLLLFYAEALLFKPHLAKKIAAFKTEAARLTVIDRELEFLRNLKQGQPPYIEVLSVLSGAVPPGIRFEALSLNSHGELSLRATFRDGQQVADFRAKLIASGFFANVTIEDQTPTPDRQKVNVRLSAQAKPLPQLQALAASLPAEATDQHGKSNSPGAIPPGVSSAKSMAAPDSRKEPK